MSTVSGTQISVASDTDIGDQLSEVHALNADGHRAAALLLGWAVLEAIARSAFADRLSKPQAAASTLEMLAFDGYVSPSEADEIRTVIDLRNRVAHGDLTVRLAKDAIDRFVEIIDMVLQRVQQPETANT